MSRSTRRRSLATAAAVVGAFAAPAAAQAAVTYTVAAGGGTCGGGDLSCESLVAAAGAVAADDAVTVAPGTYAGATFTVPGVTITGSTTAPVVVNSALVFSGNGGNPAQLQRVAVTVTSGTGPAVDVTGTSGLRLADSLLLSANGNGINLSASTANRIVRSTVATGGGGADAVSVISTGAGNRALTIDSSIVTGGAAGLAGRSSGGAAGDIAITARHLTAAGSTKGIVADASAAQGVLAGVGSIAITATDSIVMNGTLEASYPGLLGIGANTATVTATRTITAGDPNALFVNPTARNFRLRIGSPAIDQGQTVGDESVTDIDGDPRSAGAAPDQGADEFVNKPPVAKLAAASATVPAGRALTFTAAGSTDDVGPIKTYQWRFGDGQTAATTTPTVTHAYANEGPVAATLVVTDGLDVPSAASAPVTVTVTDGTPPAVSIDRPRKNQAIRLVTRTTKTVTGKDGEKTRRTTSKRTRIAFRGRALDKSGVQRIFLAVRQVSRAAATKKKKAGSSQTAAKKCRWLDPKKGIVVRSCDKPVQITAKYDAANATWTYTVPAARRLAAGTYRVSAAGIDKAGVFGNSFKPTSLVFRLR
jgi:hypothetical protein